MRSPLCRYKSIAVCLAFAMFYGSAAFSQQQVSNMQAGPRAGYQLVKGRSFVQSKNYYLLTLFESLPDVRQLLLNDPLLQQLTRSRLDSLKDALSSCGRNGLCFTSRFKFSRDEIQAVSNRLTELYKPGNPLDKMVSQHLRPSGCYIRFQQMVPRDMLVKAWEQDAMGVNFCIAVYAEGAKPNYPLIDSISFVTRDAKNPSAFAAGFTSLLYNTSSLLSLQLADTSLFFQPSVSAALQFLEMNEREQAGDFEPMISGANSNAVNKIRSTDWTKFPYSVILVPGAGPDDPKVPLSAEGMLRCRLAAIQYQRKQAPFIVVSGGKVHPYKTPFCEATEMKKFLVEKMNIPSSAIIIEPHARHTTTNMRNTVRIMYRYGIPLDKPGITCTTRGQSNMIGTTLIDRCLKELEMTPYKNGRRLSETEIEFYALLEALHIDPTEPMDP